ncbi:MAG: hypothetical protein M1492_11170 [Gammaproteobacteria bacterium]|jgi:hypothetical protein|nr:hypothetical protein [Gammaproteobacteria bacterium]
MKTKRFSKIILHAGGDKTGSTAIQSAFYDCRDLLHQNGIHYPGGRWHAELGSCFCDQPEKYIFNELAGYKDRTRIRERDAIYLSRLRQEMELYTDGLLVLSYEGFSNLDVSALQKMRDFISEYAETCEVVYYVRSPLSYAVSSMSQHVKMGKPCLRGGVPPISPYSILLDRLSKVFGKNTLNVRKFEKDTLVNGDIILDFLSIFKLPDDVSYAVASHSCDANPSLSAEAFLIGQRIIELLEECQMPREMYISRIGELLSKIKGSKLTLSAQQASDVRHASQMHCDYLKDEFGIIFADEECCQDGTSTQLSKDVVELLAKLLVEQSFPGMTKKREGESVVLQEGSVDYLSIRPENMATQVGLRGLRPSLDTSGHQGILCYGPYIKVSAGYYSVHLLGDVGSRGLAGAYVDVVHKGGKRTVTVQALSIMPSNDKVIVSPWSFFLLEDVNDLEIRIWVSEQSEINLRGIVLHKIDAMPKSEELTSNGK